MRQYFIAMSLAFLAACTQREISSQESVPKTDRWTASYQDARAISGVDQEFGKLDNRLSDLCHLGTTEQLALSESQNECIVLHMVSAFDAAEGEIYCRSELESGNFVGCITDGKLLSLVAENLATVNLPAELLWRDRDEAWRQLNKAMFAAATSKCQSDSQREIAECINDYPLGLFGIDRAAVALCPSGPTRYDCVSGVAMGTLIRNKLLNLF